VRLLRRVPVVVGLAVTLLALARLLVPSPVGLADQGDAHRLLCQVGVRDATPIEDRTGWGRSSDAYVPFVWEDHTWYGEGCGAGGTDETYRSSQVTLLRAAKALTALGGFDGDLDLRALAVVCSLLLGLLSGVLVSVLPGPRPVRVVIVACLALTLLDRGAAGVFASGYTEPAALLGLLATLAASLVVLRARRPSPAALVALAGSGLFTVTANRQMVAVLPQVLAALLWRPADPAPDADDADVPVGAGSRRPPAAEGRWADGPGGPRGRGERASRLLAAGLALVVLAVAVRHVGAQPERLAQLDRHDQVFNGILLLGNDPERDLADLGLDPALVAARGLDRDEAREIVAGDDYRAVEALTDLDVARHLATHPRESWLLVRRGVDAAARFGGETYLGSYRAGDGAEPYQTENRIWLVGVFFEIADAVPALLVGTVGFAAWLGLRSLRRARTRDGRALAAVAVGVAAAAAATFVVTIFVAGQVELTRRLLVTNVLVAWSIPLAVGAHLAEREPPPPLVLPPDAPEPDDPDPDDVGPEDPEP